MSQVSPPAPPFISARWHGGSQTPAKRIVIHGTVSKCKPGMARIIARYFQVTTRTASAHYVVDPGEVIQCVGDHKVAFHAPPNGDTIGVELCDPVAGSSARWDDNDHVLMLQRAAKLVARLCLAYDVPIRRLQSADLLAGKHGICGHIDVSQAWHQTTHTDPGPGFPWARFMGLVVKAAADLTKPVVVPPKPVAERLALDSSFVRLDPAAIKAAGIHGVSRYLSRDARKNLTRDEADGYLKQSLWINLVWEDGKTRAGAGAAAGAADVRDAEGLADAIGVPRTATIFYTVDYDASFAAVKPYWEAIHAGHKRPVGVYGGADIVDAVIGAGLATEGWQSASTAWSTPPGRISSHAKMLQRTTHSKTIKGYKAADWDEDLIIPGPIIPVWRPGDAPFVPPTPVPTKTGLVYRKRTVVALGTSDHHAVVEQFTMPSGAVIRTGTANVQGTDPARQSNGYVDSLLSLADLWVWNEITTQAQQKHLLSLPGWTTYMANPSAVADKGADTNAVCISLRNSVWELVSGEYHTLHPGASGITPVRVDVLALLKLRATGEYLWRQGTQTVHHVEVDGMARVKDQLKGQNDRARISYPQIVEHAKVATSTPVPGNTNETAPLIGSGDLNWDWDLDRGHYMTGDGTAWSPYRVFHGVFDAYHCNTGLPTHGNRKIDWFWFRQADTAKPAAAQKEMVAMASPHVVEADPKKPYKAAVATAVPLVILVLVALANQILESGNNIPPWLALLATAIVSGLGTYAVRNPKKPAV